MTVDQFLNKLKEDSENIQFEETMAAIDTKYSFSDTAFTNGDQNNAAGENSGSCRLFSFAQLEGLNEQQTLCCFGQYYQEVLDSPDSDSHQNIRQFMMNGWTKISFTKPALALK